MFTIIARIRWIDNTKKPFVQGSEFKFTTLEFPTKEQILEAIKKRDEEAWKRLNDIFYLYKLDWSKRCQYGLLKNIEIENNYASSIFITEKP